MTYHLAKTDPETYSIDDLEREHRTVWDGVKNPQALRAIAAMRPVTGYSFTIAWARRPW